MKRGLSREQCPEESSKRSGKGHNDNSEKGTFCISDKEDAK